MAKNFFIFFDILEAMTSATAVTTSMHTIALFLVEDVSKSSSMTLLMALSMLHPWSLCVSPNLMPK